MRTPDPEDIDSEFQILDDEYDDPEFYGGAFEGSHAFGDVVVLRLYSVVPGDGDVDELRVETRHHASGHVLDHDQTEYELGSDRSLSATGQSLEEFCRDHHYEDPHSEILSAIDAVKM